MLLVKNEFIEAINDCSWLENCGKCSGLELGFDVNLVQDTKEVLKNINGNKWEDITLQKQNDLTSFLFLNYRNEYQQWNDILNEFKKKDMKTMIPKIKTKLKEIGLSENVMPSIEWDIMSLFMANAYSKYYKDIFYEKMLKIYLSGHLPCGWVGGLKNGTFLVY